jgi:hypothetical protein
MPSTHPLTSSFSSIRTSHVHLNNCPMRDTCSRLKPIRLAPKVGFCAFKLVEQAGTKWTCPASHKRLKACVRFFVHGFESPLLRLMIVYFFISFLLLYYSFQLFFNTRDIISRTLAAGAHPFQSSRMATINFRLPLHHLHHRNLLHPFFVPTFWIGSC